MTTARAFLRMRASRCGGSSEIVTEMTATSPGLTDSAVMTLSFIRFDRGCGLHWVRAGHPPARSMIPPPTFQGAESRGRAGVA